MVDYGAGPAIARVDGVCVPFAPQRLKLVGEKWSVLLAIPTPKIGKRCSNDRIDQQPHFASLSAADKTLEKPYYKSSIFKSPLASSPSPTANFMLGLSLVDVPDQLHYMFVGRSRGLITPSQDLTRREVSSEQYLVFTVAAVALLLVGLEHHSSPVRVPIHAPNPPALRA